MSPLVLVEVGFGSRVVQELLSEWNMELGFVPKGGATVEETDFMLPAGVFLVARVGDIAVGCGGLRRLGPGTGEIKRVFVRTAARRRGVARALVADLERRAVKLGLEEVRLDTHAEAPASFFRSVGYEPVPNYNGNPYARYWFAKRLPSARSVASLASEGGDPTRLARFVRDVPALMRALEAARVADPPEWLICAGAIRDAVWDELHGRVPAGPRDIDLAFFDPDDLSPACDRTVEAQLRRLAPELPWQAKNQAAVHLWYPRRCGLSVAPFCSSAEAVATFPEIATCVGARLLGDDDLLIVAPHGLDDLLGGVCRHNPARVPASFYERRIDKKGWRTRWPRVRYVPPVLTGS